MNGGDFKVTPGQLLSTSAALKLQADTLRAQLEQFNNDVAARSATWEGAAKESYTQKQGEWSAGREQMHAALLAFAELVDRIAGNYVATDRQGEATFNGMGIGR